MTRSLPDDLPARLHRNVARLRPNARRVVLAVSGGPDSLVLLHALRPGPWSLHVAHLDHGLRPESSEDARWLERTCADWQVPFHSERVDVAAAARQAGRNLEDAARTVRYAFLARVAKEVRADAVLTAHTRDDHAETVLMQLLRGAAYPIGIRESRGRVVRPLLDTGRAEILAYLVHHGLPQRLDPTNADRSRTRAWLRHDVLPLLRARLPDVTQRLARHAARQQDIARHFDAATDAMVGDTGNDEGDGGLELATFVRRDAALQRHALARLLERHGVARDQGVLERLRSAAIEGGTTRVSLPGGATGRVAGGRLHVLRPQGAASSSGERPVRSAAELPPDIEPEALDAHPDLVYRTRRPGDRIRLAGGTKRVADLLIDRKVPREERDALRVLAAGSRVLWIDGVAVDASYAAHTVPPDDAHWMRRALELAREAAARGEVPIGAVVVRAGEVVGTGSNRTEEARDPTRHAELDALREAAARTGDWRLAGCTLYVTLEPCPMCFGAVLGAHLARVVYGAQNERDGALGGVADLRDAPWKRRVAVRPGVLASECSALLGAFFRERRASSRA